MICILLCIKHLGSIPTSWGLAGLGGRVASPRTKRHPTHPPQTSLRRATRETSSTFQLLKGEDFTQATRTRETVFTETETETQRETDSKPDSLFLLLSETTNVACYSEILNERRIQGTKPKVRHTNGET